MRVRISTRLLSTVTLLISSAFVSCSNDGGNDPTNPESEAGVTYTFSPSTLLLAPGQSGTATVTVTRSPDFDGDLTLALGGLFNDVTGSFSPASLPKSTSSTVLTIRAGTGGANFGTMNLSIDPSLSGRRVNVNGTAPTLAVTVSIKPTVVINKAGNGTGTITSSPSGINCGTICTSTFLFAPVTLTAAPAQGSTFVGWSGLCAGTALTCTFTPRVTTNSNFNFGTATFASTTPIVLPPLP